MYVVCFVMLGAEAASLSAQKIKVPTDVPEKAKAHVFRDSRHGVRFRVPAGWTINRKDHQVSTFRLDARSATERSQMRAVASLDFNPFPQSTFSGALFYYSVEPHATDAQCASEVTGFAKAEDAGVGSDLKAAKPDGKDLQDIGGMDFMHGHDEHGGICVEARDEVYTAFRKGSCYRFDMAVNTFCSISSGAQELTRNQMHSIESRMTEILSSVALDWEKSGPHEVPVPEVPVEKREMEKGGRVVVGSS